MEYPTEEEINAASHFELGRWFRFLGSPKNEVESKCLREIVTRFKNAGGWNPEISKAIGWNERND